MTSDLVVAIMASLPDIKGGSLSFHGEIFGGRIDNWHQVTGARDVDGATVIDFATDGEHLTVWEPNGIEVGPGVFRIDSAKRLTWEWSYYGRPATPENRCTTTYETATRGRIRVSPTGMTEKEHMITGQRASAVEVLGF